MKTEVLIQACINPRGTLDQPSFRITGTIHSRLSVNPRHSALVAQMVTLVVALVGGLADAYGATPSPIRFEKQIWTS
jgi:hypothetical protein